MSESGQQPELKPGQPLTIRAIVLGGVLMGLVGAAAVVALLFFYGGGTDQDRARLDVVRTAGALVLGTGGAIALLLTARRQRSTELTLEHQRRVAAAAERDAAEQRITELYTHAVDQLGNDKAPVRLGGLHALERLAQDNPNQRQTIVDVICAYLRMPYTPPVDKPPAEDAPADAHDHYEKRRQELQVRMTAQRILTGHLQPQVADVFWQNIHLDLTEAHLHRLDLTGCHMRKAQFAGVRFSGPACFERAQFTEEAQFSAAKFTAEANFRWVSCLGDARFDGAEFAGEAAFGSARFDGEAEFKKTRFAKNADFGHGDFDGARFVGDAQFSGAKFLGNVWFNRAEFVGRAQFDDQVEFAGEAGFDATRFDGQARFDAARFAMDATFTKRDGFVGARFGGRAEFSGAEFTRNAKFYYAEFTEAFFNTVKFGGEADFGKARFAEDTEFDNAQFGGYTNFSGAQLDSSRVSFKGARARPGHHHFWPTGWTVRDARTVGDELEGWMYLARVEDSTD